MDKHTTKFTDTAYQPIQSDGSLRYQRGDGAIVTMKIDKSDSTVTPPLTTNVTEHGTVIVPPIIMVNPDADVVIRDADSPIVDKPGQHAPLFKNDKILDHPLVGGRVTVFILFYGGEEYHQLHKQCLTSLLDSTSRDRVDLRVGSNQLNDKSVAMIEQFVTTGVIAKHYRHTENAYKYPVMREMFYDPDHPIDTKWVLWFDDDSICVDSQWLHNLALLITQRHRNNEAHMFGTKMVWTTNSKQRQIMSSRPWYHNRPWRQHNGEPSPNGSKIQFVSGGFWAITHEAMIAADIPDLGTGLTHNGGDWQIGEQLYQAGYTIKMFNTKKQFVNTSSVPRRGVTSSTIDKIAAPTTAKILTPPQPGMQQPQLQTPREPKLRRVKLP